MFQAKLVPVDSGHIFPTDNRPPGMVSASRRKDEPVPDYLCASTCIASGNTKTSAAHNIWQPDPSPVPEAPHILGDGTGL